MKTRWLAVICCAVTSSQLTTPRGGVKAQSSPSVLTASFTSGQASQTARLNRKYTWDTASLGTPGASSFIGAASQTDRMHLAIADDFWSTHDAMRYADAELIDAPAPSSSFTMDKSDCHWLFEGANNWACKFKPLSRHDFPVSRTLRRLWPLHGKNDGQ